MQLSESDVKIFELEKQNNNLKNANEQLKSNLESRISMVKLKLKI